MKIARPISRQFSTYTMTNKAGRVTKNPISLNRIQELHAHLIRTHRYLDSSSISEVIKSYALFPSTLPKAHFVFNQIDRPALLVWNHMIRGLSQSDRPSEAICFYYCMYQQGLAANDLTLIFVFKACARVSDVVQGQKINVHSLKLGFQSNVVVSNALIHMYAASGDMGSAKKVFDEMGEKDLVSWNSLICGYSQCNRFKKVLDIFKAMQAENLEADAVTMMKVILACSNLSEWEIADSVIKYIDDNHLYINVYLGNTMIDMYGRRGLVDLAQGVFDRMHGRNIVSWNALIRGYAKVGNLDAAQKLFDGMENRDVISWTSMITGYSQANQFTEAVKLFIQMLVAKVKPDEITVASVLSACAHVGLFDVGEAVHRYIREHGVKADVYVGNSLIDMYCKCGVVEKALEVFQEMKRKDSISWTSVISGLAVNGFAESALELFSRMLREGIQPTHGAFVGILLACAHVGLVDEGLDHFESMEKVYGLTPEMKHYGCVVDLLSRSGNLDRACEFIKKMPIAPDVVVWRIFLSACNLHGNVVLAEIAKNKLLELDPSNSGNYVLSSHAYASSERWDDVVKIRELMEESNVQKPFGCSSIEVNGPTSYNAQEPYVIQS